MVPITLMIMGNSAINTKFKGNLSLPEIKPRTRGPIKDLKNFIVDTVALPEIISKGPYQKRHIPILGPDILAAQSKYKILTAKVHLTRTRANSKIKFKMSKD